MNAFSENLRVPRFLLISNPFEMNALRVKSSMCCHITTLDSTCNYMHKSFFDPTLGNDTSSVRSFCTGRFDPNLKEESGFFRELVHISGWFYQKSRMSRFGVKSKSNPKDDKTKNDAVARGRRLSIGMP